MKKNLYLLLATILLAITGMTFTSCGDDNDDPIFDSLQNGTITIKYSGSRADKYYVQSASWRYYSKSNKTTFLAHFMEKSDDLIPSHELSFDIEGTFDNKTELDIKNIWFGRTTQSILDFSSHDQAGGKVTVKSANDDTVTLEFKDVKFGNETLNGEITYTCDTETNEEPSGTAIEKMCGYWDVVYDAVDENGNLLYTDEEIYGAGTCTVFTYNLADNGTKYMWLDDQETFWAYKIIVNIDYDKRTFWCDEKDYDAVGSGTAIITDGKIIENGGLNEHGMPTDSISFYVKFSDDDYADVYYDRLWCHGVRHSGFSPDPE